MNLFENIKENYVSFDIFDTLLYRKVEKPEKIFEIVEEKLKKIDSKEFQNFYNKRIEAQKQAQSSNKIEATINDIYNLIDIKQELKKKALEIEIETEIENLYPNAYLTQRIDMLKKEGKKIVIISDMYLSKDIITRFLNDNKIYFDYLYVSSDIQLRKSNGALFKYVMKDLRIRNTDMIHVGDNYKSDYIMAKINGIKAYRWKKEELQHKDKLKNIEDENAKKLYDILNEYKTSNLYTKIGFELFGPLLLGFCQWLQEKQKENNLNGMCFLSRDGQIIKKAYDKMYKNDYPYFLASRRTLTVPLLKNAKNMKEILKIVPYIKREEKVDDLLKKIGVESEKISTEIKSIFGENISRTILVSKDGDRIFDIVKDEMYKNASLELTAAKEYIKYNLPKGKIGLVDIGWYGTMQKSMDKICSEISDEHKFYGLYVGLLQKESNKQLNNASGYIYDYLNKDNVFDSNLVFGFNGLIELMFTANHGSAKKYIINNGKSECILEEDKGEYSQFVKEVQEGALEFIDYVIKNNITLKISNKIAFTALEDLLSNPTIYECEILGDLYFYDAYFEKIIQFEDWKKLIKNPKRTLSNFLKSNWKIGFFRKMGFKNPSKVYRIFEKIK